MSNPELHSIVTGDGTEYFLNDSDARAVLNPTPGGWGLPPVDYVRSRLYKQDGQVELDYFLKPRRFAIRVSNEGCSREEYFQLRSSLLDIVRPNRMGQLTYTFERTDGTKRSIIGRALSPVFSEVSPDEWDDYAYRNEGIQIECIDPLWFDPTSTTVAGTAEASAQLVFPITFPITFNTSDLWGAATLTYTGSWYAYPIITATGSWTQLQIQHVESGQVIDYLRPAASGEVVTFDLTIKYDSSGNFQGVTVTDDSGVDRISSLGDQTDLLMFRIEPAGVYSSNTLRFIASGSNASTNFSVEYTTKYIGI